MRLCFFIVSLLFISSCKEKDTHDQKIINLPTPQEIAKEVVNELPSYLIKDSIIQIDSVKLTCYSYFKKNYSDHLCWFNGNKLNANGRELYNYIKHCRYNGLMPQHYHFSKIKKEIISIFANKKSVNITQLIKTDLFLSDAYYLLGAHLNKGRFYADSLLLQTNFKNLKPGWDSLLWAGYKSKTIKGALDSLEPKHYHYHMLKKELATLLNDSSLYAFDSIPFISEKDSVVRKKLIIKHLIKQHLYDTISLENDSLRLVKALNQFQKKWFIQPDGKLGKYTKQAFGYNREKIIRQINMAMERWRWEEEKFPVRYAFINIPAFWLTVYEKDTVALQSAIVCGKPETQTPILKSKIDHIIIYPYWNVPTTIATKEILPAVQRDTTYLRRKNFEVLGKNNMVLDYTTIPWRKYTKDYLPVRFRQRIGDDNSLGVMKFNFYNPYGVYLHDTNSKRYFKTSSRSQSHGCIRLEKFMDMADFLIRDDSVHYRHDSVILYIVLEQQRRINLRKPLPIYTRYYTANADSTGLKIYLDIYRKDEAMMNLLYR